MPYGVVGEYCPPVITENIIVDYDGGKVDVTPRRVDEVVAADCGGIAIAHQYYDVELWFFMLYLCCEGNVLSVGGMSVVSI